jgi:hypothetical protein
MASLLPRTLLVLSIIGGSASAQVSPELEAMTAQLGAATATLRQSIRASRCVSHEASGEANALVGTAITLRDLVQSGRLDIARPIDVIAWRYGRAESAVWRDACLATNSAVTACLDQVRYKIIDVHSAWRALLNRPVSEQPFVEPAEAAVPPHVAAEVSGVPGGYPFPYPEVPGVPPLTPSLP